MESVPDEDAVAKADRFVNQPSSSSEPPRSPRQVHFASRLSLRPVKTIQEAIPRLSTRPFSSPNVDAAWFRSASGTQRYRFLDRKAPFEQSNGHLNLFRGVSKETEKAIRKLYFTDWYHTFLNFKLRWQLIFFMLTYLSFWTIYAGLLWAINDKCNLGMEYFLDAYYLSIETVQTIGYGVPDSYFRQCAEMAVFMSLEVMLSTVLNAFLIGVIFSRLSRPQSRASTIIFSSKMVVQYNEDGAPHLLFRVADLRRHELIEGHIRCYCVMHNNENLDSFQRSGLTIFPMRLNQPDDTLGGMLLLAAPQFVIHRIDGHSPLSPYFKAQELQPTNPSWDDFADKRRERIPRNPNVVFQTTAAGSVPQRMGDADTGNRSSFMCEICGCEFSAFYSLQKHVEFERDSHGTYAPKPFVEPSESDLQDHWKKLRLEVFVVCEGIEPFTSSTVQARHSFLIPDDVLFGHSFLPCVRVQPSGICLFDVTRFHSTADTVDRNSIPLDPETPLRPDSRRQPISFFSEDPGLVLIADDAAASARNSPTTRMEL